MRKDEFPLIESYADSKVNEVLDKIRADYEARLRADMVAMLTDIQLEMEEYEPKWVENDEQAVASNRTWEDLDGIIQQKIDALKAESEG